MTHGHPHWGTGLNVVRTVLTAAVRETFEECGVLLARPKSNSVMADPRDFEDERTRLEAGELSFDDFLATHRLVPDVSMLRPLSRWVTPAGEPRRYDTRFFLAALPPGQDARQASDEASAVQWMDPATALRNFRGGNTMLMPPTWAQFHDLQQFGTVSEALPATGDTAPVMPQLVPNSVPLRVRFWLEDDYYADSPYH